MPPACAGDHAKSKWGYLTGDVEKSMKSIRRRQMNKILASLLPRWDESDGWTYNHFFKTPYLRLGESESLEALHAATRQAIAHFIPTQLRVFHDGQAAWRSRWRGNRGFLCATPAEVIELVNLEAYFRDAHGYSDNYNVIGDDGRWMITYCHEDDWFLFAPQSDLNQLKRKMKKTNKAVDSTASRPAGAELAGHGASPPKTLEARRGKL